MGGGGGRVGLRRLYFGIMAAEGWFVYNAPRFLVFVFKSNQLKPT